MMFGKIAVLDLGTNTFHLLIAEVLPGLKINFPYRASRFVKLAEFGIEKIPQEKIEFAMEVIHELNEQITIQGATYIQVYATETFRKASNSQELIDRILEETGLEIEVISGEREAELIYKGVNLACQLNEEPVLIMDIGGGSTEFLIANNEKIFERFSFEAGATVLKNKFQKEDRLSDSERNNLEDYLSQTFAPLFESLKSYEVKKIIGASGSFDTIINLMQNRDPKTVLLINDFVTQPEINVLKSFCDEIINTNADQRAAMEIKGMNANRAPYMPVACVLIQFILNQTQLNELIVSDFALKEGIIVDLLEPKEETEEEDQTIAE